MPTETSNTDMVSVPRDLLQMIEMSWRVPNGCPASVAEEAGRIIRNGLEQLRDILAQPAEQHQGEPIMLTAVATLIDDGDGGLEASWLLEGGTAELFAGMTLLVAENAPELCQEDGTAPVYTHADPGEIERVTAQFKEWQASHHANYCKVADERDTLRAQLAEFRSALEGMVEYSPEGHSDGECFSVEKAKSVLSASAEPSEPVECAICRDLGGQCMECEEAEFREWADRHFASADYRKTAAGVFIQDWMRHAYAAWCARAALARKA